MTPITSKSSWMRSPPTHDLVESDPEGVRFGYEVMERDWRPGLDLNQDKERCTALASRLSATGPTTVWLR
jgi:hypothetical protein